MKHFFLCIVFIFTIDRIKNINKFFIRLTRRTSSVAITHIYSYVGRVKSINLYRTSYLQAAYRQSGLTASLNN